MVWWAWAIVAIGVLATCVIARACWVQAGRADDEMERMLAEALKDKPAVWETPRMTFPLRADLEAELDALCEDTQAAEEAHQMKVGEGLGLIG